jgi:hypothetical protein
MGEPEQDARSEPRRRRIPFAHVAVLVVFTALLAPFLRPSYPACGARVALALEDREAAPEVLRSCRRELERHTRESDPERWAELQLGIGRLLAATGELGAAADAHRSALLALPRERAPRCWASVHYTIGRLLMLQKKRMPAAAAYRSALAELDASSPEAELARRGLAEMESARGLGTADTSELQGGLATRAEWDALLAMCRDS